MAMFNPMRVAGPIFEFELLTSSRRGRYYAIRSGYAFVLLLVIWQIDEFWVAEFGNMLTPTLAARFALTVFAAIAIGQEILVLLLTPAMVSGVITSEKQRKTLHYLMASCLGGFEIVFGKLFAKMLYIAVFLAVGLPISSLLVLLGGIDPLFVVLATVCTICTAFFLCSLSVFVSVYSKSTREALFVAYTLEVLWLVVPQVIRWGLSASLPELYEWLAPLNEWLLVSSPIGFISGILPWAGSPRGISEFYEMMGLQLGAGLLLAFVASLRLRSVFRAQSDAPKPALSKLLMARGSNRWVARPECGDHPMAWKEQFTSRKTRLMRIVGGLAFIGIAIPLGYYGAEGFLLALQESWNSPDPSWKGKNWSTHLARLKFGYFIAGTIPVMFTLGLIGVAGRAAASITSEHEGDTWTCLTATDLSPREVVLAKIAGALKPAFTIIVVMMVLAVLGSIVGSVHWLTLPLVTIDAVIFMTFAAVFGVCISMQLKSTWRAQFLTIALLFLLGMLGQTFLNLSRQYAPSVWPGFFPSDIARAIIEPDAIEYLRRGDYSWRDLRLGEIGGNDPWLVVFGVLSPLIYGSLACFLTVLAIRGYDRAAGRPRRSKREPLPLKTNQAELENRKARDFLTSNC